MFVAEWVMFFSCEDVNIVKFFDVLNTSLMQQHAS